MRYFRFGILLSLIAVCSTTIAFAAFDFNANCQEAYGHIMALRLIKGKELIQKEKQNHPDNDFIPLLENYHDYILLLCSPDKTLFDQAKKAKSGRLDRLSSGDSHSPYYLWAQAQVNLQWALLRGRYEEYLPAAFEIKKANGLLQESVKSFPNFLPSQMALGMVQAVLGSLPSSAQKALATVGVKGDTDRGKLMLEKTTKGLNQTTYAVFYDEAVFYLSQVYVNITKEPNSYQKIAALSNPISDQSLLKTYILAYTALKTGKNEQAIGHLQDRPGGTGYQNYPYLTYLHALAKMNRLDKDAAKLFQQFIAENKQEAFTKDAYLRLAWCALLSGDKSGYNTYVGKVKAEGSAYDEKDKQAIKEVNEAPQHKELLKSRLLYDGGYYQQAKQCLVRLDPNKLPLLRDKIEFCYRYARVFHDTNNPKNALKFFKSAIDLGGSSSYYYAANSALLSGNIYEEQKNYQQAALFYQQAIGMKNYPYEGSIKSRAKEGLNRVKGKM